MQTAMICLLLAFALCAPAPADAQVNGWWYPNGSPGNDGRVSIPTSTGNASMLVPKWRSHRLTGARTVLLGNLRDPVLLNVVGISAGGDSIVILDGRGHVDTILPLRGYLPPNGVPHLTGLFNTTAPSLMPSGRPNAIGVGVEMNAEQGRVPYGLLFAPGGALINRLEISTAEHRSLLLNQRPENRRVGLYPVAAWLPRNDSIPVAVAVLTQDGWMPYTAGVRSDTMMLNSIRRYRLKPGQDLRRADLEELFPVAPRAYAGPPALWHEPSTGRSYISLTTERYPHDPSERITTLTIPRGTQSDSAAAVHVDITDRAPSGVRIETSTDGSMAESVILRLITDTAGTVQPTRLMIDRRVTAPGSRPRIAISSAVGVEARGSFSENVPGQQGWHVVSADVDGTAPSAGAPLVNTPGPEFLATWTPETLAPGEQNWLYLLRVNNTYPIPSRENPEQGRPYYYLTRQLVQGRVVAAGDLVADEHGRDEIVLLTGSAISILQLKSYFSDEIRLKDEASRQPFTTLATFDLQEEIVDVAIADLEGDGRNDLVVSTDRGIWGIGVPEESPFGEFSPLDTLCAGELVTLSWETPLYASAGSPTAALLIGQREVELSVENDSTLSFLPSAHGVVNGEVRVIIRDGVWGEIADTSGPIRISPAAIGQVSTSPAVPMPGEQITVESSVHCIDDVVIEVSLTGSVWIEIPSQVLQPDETGEIKRSTRLDCSLFDDCYSDLPDRVLLRVRHAQAGGVSGAPVEVALNSAELAVDVTPIASESSRVRSFEWSRFGFPCETIGIYVVGEDGEEELVTTAARSEGEIPELLLSQYTDGERASVCVRCIGEVDPCLAKQFDFEVPLPPGEHFLYPNPASFSPSTGDGVQIVYELDKQMEVTVEIFDASRSLVRTIVDREMRGPGPVSRDTWDGRSHDGREVANGTYICVISPRGQPAILLPLIVNRSRDQ